MAGVQPGQGVDRSPACHEVGAAASVDVQIDEAGQNQRDPVAGG